MDSEREVLVQLFALGCNGSHAEGSAYFNTTHMAEDRDISCDLDQPSRAMLLRINCTGAVAKLPLRNDEARHKPCNATLCRARSHNRAVMHSCGRTLGWYHCARR